MFLATPRFQSSLPRGVGSGTRLVALCQTSAALYDKCPTRMRMMPNPGKPGF